MAVDGQFGGARRGRFPMRLGLAAMLAALGGLLLVARPACAQGDDVFTVRGVAVDATDQTAAAARVKALAEGQRRALRHVFERIVLAEDLARQPRLADRQIEALVQALEIDKERTSAVRYLAELTVRFKPDEMRGLMQQAGMRFAETMSRPVVVLPVYKSVQGAQEAVLLWEDDNPWRRAWAGLPAGTGLVPLIVPIGDLTDADAVDAAAALGGDDAKLGAIAARYRAGEVIVSVLTARDDPRTKAMLLQYQTVRPRQGQTAADTAAAALAPERPIVVPPAAALDERLAALAREQARAIEEQWKRSHVMRFGEEQRLSLSLPLSGLGDLVEARRRLSELSAVRRVEVIALTRKVARLSIAYAGDPEQLRAAVLQKDMELLPDPPDWQLRLAPGAGAAAGGAARPQ